MELLTRVDEGRIQALLHEGTYVWIDLAQPDRETIEALGRALPIHALALEDSLEQGQRPKVDDYGDSAFIVAYGARSTPDGVAIPVEVHLHVGAGFLVVLHEVRLSEVAYLRERAADGSDGWRGGSITGALDGITDSLVAAVDLQHALERLRPEVLQHPDREVLGRVDDLHGHIDRLHGLLDRQRESFGAIVGVVLGLSETPKDAEVYLADVRDHLEASVSAVSQQVTAVDRLMDLYLNASSQQASLVSGRLAFLTGLLVPLTLVTGFFGMNFRWMTDEVDSSTDFFVFGVGGTVVALMVSIALQRGTSRT